MFVGGCVCKFLVCWFFLSLPVRFLSTFVQMWPFVVASCHWLVPFVPYDPLEHGQALRFRIFMVLLGKKGIFQKVSIAEHVEFSVCREMFQPPVHQDSRHVLGIFVLQLPLLSLERETINRLLVFSFLPCLLSFSPISFWKENKNDSLYL